MADAASVLALLSEPNKQLQVGGAGGRCARVARPRVPLALTHWRSLLQVHALGKLEALLDVNWPEVSEVVAQLEALAEDVAFPAREVRQGGRSRARARAWGGG